MDEMRWLSDELLRSCAGFAWAIRQVEDAHLRIAPPQGLGEWPALRHLHHLVWYEREYALPSMRHWVGGPPLDDQALDEAAAWAAEGPGFTVEGGVRELEAGREAQAALLAVLDPSAWHASVATVWGDMPPRWVVSKTYQHTAEHTNDVLRIALFWPFFEADGG
jgi:hypothetical protein